ncbi:MAG: hypothetical protein ABSG41_04775 [Bryobacteraceae bacterium]|jgi:hypothetical protein
MIRAYIALLLLASLPLAAQTPARTAPATKTWKQGKTPDGQPDIQGVWVNFDSTPFERAAASATGTSAAPASGNQNALLFADRAPKVQQRPSMVVDPPDGRVPLTPWAEQQRDYDLSHVQDSWEYNTTWERCITRGIPAAIFPAGYNNGYQILQTPGQVVILYEMIHEARIIPVDGRPHLPAALRQWNGDPRGHWEGNTLVVETTNFNGKGMIATNAASARIRSVPETENAHIVERFTRVDENTINYEVTIDDPKVASAPWKVAMPLARDDSYKIYEYMCHEANRDYMEITLGGGRLKEKTDAAAGRK